jgi:flagellar biosynthesis/type III secretory pathway protein FliH
VGKLPDVPVLADIGELPEAPSLDDTNAFQAWREALTELSFERGKKAGIAEGQQVSFERGTEAGVAEGQLQALFTILAARGIPVDAEARARIEALAEPAVIHQWIARAMTVGTVAELFALEPGGSEPS